MALALMNIVSSPKAYAARLYTPAQTFTATVMGGPAAGAWTLFWNFRAISRSQAAWVALITGLAACVVVAIVALKYVGYFSLYHVHPVVFPLVYSGGALVLGHVLFAETVTAHIQLGGRKNSWWTVAGISIVGIVVAFAAVALVHKISPAVDYL